MSGSSRKEIENPIQHGGLSIVEILSKFNKKGCEKPAAGLAKTVDESTVQLFTNTYAFAVDETSTCAFAPPRPPRSYQILREAIERRLAKLSSLANNQGIMDYKEFANFAEVGLSTVAKGATMRFYDVERGYTLQESPEISIKGDDCTLMAAILENPEITGTNDSMNASIP